VFFADLQRDEPTFEQVHRFYDRPDSLPEHWLAGECDVHAVLARTADTVLTVRVAACYPRGLELALRAYTAPPSEAEQLQRPHRWAGDDLRLGLLWRDGRRAENDVDRYGHHEDTASEPAAFTLTTSGGSGGGLSYDFRYWLHPLPPPETVQLLVRWDVRGIPETSVELDLTPAVAAAADAVELWHLPTFEEDPPSGGWFAYSPGGPYVTGSAPAPDDDASRDALDGQDEDG